jgi:hypothetical protein
MEPRKANIVLVQHLRYGGRALDWHWDDCVGDH